jgi:hypothetical protein
MRNLVCLAQHTSSHSLIRPVVWLFWVDSYQSNYLVPKLFSSIGVEETLNAQCFGRMLISTFEQCSDYLKFFILIRPSLEKFLMHEKPIKNIALLGPGAGGCASAALSRSCAQESSSASSITPTPPSMASMRMWPRLR